MKQYSSPRVFLVLLATLSIGCQSRNDVASKPNVVLVMTDDQGYGDIAAHGNTVIRTPNLDRLHGESLRLTDFHVAPVCTPTRAELMTGQDAVRTGAWGTTWGRSLPNRDLPAIADVFADNGYRTGHFGKWHLGDNYPFRPEDRGFQEVVRHGGGGVGQAPDYWGNDYFDDTYCHNGEWKKYDGYCTDVWFGEAMRFITESVASEKPFFCYIPTNAPHGPFNVAEHYEEMYADNGSVVNAAFYGMITNFDENMGRLEEKLKELGIRENTILVYLTDNGSSACCSLDGESFVEKGYNSGMRGKKGSFYEGGHRVPFFIRWPGGGLGGGKDLDAATQAQDVLPTLSELCGLSLPAGATLDGSSFAGVLTGRQDSLADRMMVVQYSQSTTPPPKWRAAVLWDKWRLVHGDELYDIKADPGQRSDIAAANPEVVNRMREHYEQWWSEVSAGFDAMSHIVIGDDSENPAELSSFDWHTQTPWNQPQVRSAAEANSFWAVEAARGGKYRIALRRWPRAIDVPITEAPADGGKALPVRSARLQIGDLDETIAVGADDREAVFTVDLNKGQTKMQTWFLDGAGKELCGAYHVVVERL